MQNFQDAFETRKRSCISVFSICMTVPLNSLNNRSEICKRSFRELQDKIFELFEKGKKNYEI